MKCYYHHDRDAFGVCKVCGKGLCLECMATKTPEVKCKTKCGSGMSLYQIVTALAFLIIIALLLVSIFE